MAASSHSSRSSTPASEAMARSPVDDRRERVVELRRGPWTVDEDLALVNYITEHGEGRWNTLAPAAGLNRTGKSCRLRWLNYLRPDVKRGNFTADEQLLILDLHSRYGNRWSKIAQHLPGRTDNEIKNYWRTRVQKHAKQLNCDANSKRFKDAMRYLWMPRLVDANDAALLRHHADHQQPAYYYHAAGAGAALSGFVVTPSSSDSVATSESHDATAFPIKNWEPASFHDESSGLYAGASAEMLVSGDGDCCWAQAEMSQHHQQAAGTTWPAEQTQVAQQVVVHNIGGGHHGQFEDAELSGWVQSFSEGVTSDTGFWTLEDIWKTQ